MWILLCYILGFIITGIVNVRYQVHDRNTRKYDLGQTFVCCIFWPFVAVILGMINVCEYLNDRIPKWYLAAENKIEEWTTPKHTVQSVAQEIVEELDKYDEAIGFPEAEEEEDPLKDFR